MLMSKGHFPSQKGRALLFNFFVNKECICISYVWYVILMLCNFAFPNLLPVLKNILKAQIFSTNLKPKLKCLYP